MKKFLLFAIGIIFTLLPFKAKPQQVIATSGGYYEGNNISLSWTLGEPVVETFTSGNIVLTQGFQQPYNFYLQQILNIPAGWSGVSTYLDPLNKGVESIFAPYENDLVILASMSDFYYPAQNINNIGNWNINTGYKIKAENEFDLTLTGSRIENATVNLAEGWNLIPVLSSCVADVESLFAGVELLQIVKEVAGPNLYWPQYGINTLETLYPGKAYFAASEDAASITFPACSKSATAGHKQGKPENTTPWQDVHYTASSHVIAFPAKVIAGSGIKTGDIVGAFTAEEFCAGRLEITSMNINAAITAFAQDDVTALKDGFEDGEMLQFKVYRPDQDQEFDLDVKFDPALPNTGIFAIHGLSAVKSLKLLALDLQELSSLSIEVYPNPSKGVFNINLNRWPNKLQIQITDVRGNIIKVIQPREQFSGSVYTIDLSGNPRGVYFLKLLDEGLVGIKKIVIN